MVFRVLDLLLALVLVTVEAVAVLVWFFWPRVNCQGVRHEPRPSARVAAHLAGFVLVTAGAGIGLLRLGLWAAAIGQGLWAALAAVVLVGGLLELARQRLFRKPPDNPTTDDPHTTWPPGVHDNPWPLPPGDPDGTA